MNAGKTLFLLLAVVQFATGQLTSKPSLDIAALKHSYEGKTLIVRSLSAGKQLKFSTAGILTSAAPGPWTLYGLVQVKNIKAKKDRLHLECTRVFATYDLGRKRFELHNSNVPLDINFPIDVDMEVEKILSAIFLGNDEDLESIVPGYWKNLVSGIGTNGAYRPGVTPFDPETIDIVKKLVDVLPGALVDQEHNIYKLGGDVTQPKAIHPVEPTYNELAQNVRIQGVVILQLVVTEKGEPQDIRILRPLGMGLDEAALETVSRWKFKPAMKNRSPVSVYANVELAFNLY